jgi:ATP-binding cassette subfamily C (CFTR/MRP) protein 10
LQELSSCFNILNLLGKPASVLSDYEDYVLHSEFDISDSSSSHSKNDKLLRSDADTKSVSGDSILEEEEREEGNVQLNVYFSYLRAIGYLLSGAILISMFLMQSTRNLTDWWLSYWVSICIKKYKMCLMFSYKISGRLEKRTLCLRWMCSLQ